MFRFNFDGKQYSMFKRWDIKRGRRTVNVIHGRRRILRTLALPVAHGHVLSLSCPAPASIKLVGLGQAEGKLAPQD